MGVLEGGGVVIPMIRVSAHVPTPQITFSQIDKTVLGALPPYLRREVVSQVEARKRQRQHGDSIVVSSPPLRPPTMPSSPSSVNVGGSGGGGGIGGGGVIGGAGTVAGRGGGGYETEVVREGFDLNVREGSAKVQQVRGKASA